VRMTKADTSTKTEEADKKPAAAPEAVKPEEKIPAKKKKETKKTTPKSKDVSFPSNRIWPD